MILIKLRTHKEDLTPEKAEQHHRYAPGFAECVRKTIRKAKARDNDSRWGWCTVEVRVTMITNDKKVTGSAYLGECSYESEEDFVFSSGYFDDLVGEALDKTKQQKKVATLMTR